MRGWRPSASLEVLRARARGLALVHKFMRVRGVLEVETPVLSRGATPDPAVQGLQLTVGKGSGSEPRFLHTSPEFAMKRLLAAGSGSIYQLARVFRDDEAGRIHAPEFTLLEWYRTGFDHVALMDEVFALVRTFVEGLPGVALAQRIAPKPVYYSYGELFRQVVEIDPHDADARSLAQCCQTCGLEVPTHWSARDMVDALFALHVLPSLPADQLCFITDFPADQAALAQVRTDQEPPVASRFELIWQGMELANGFHELRDADEQRRRFDLELAARQEAGLAQVPVDEHMLAALEAGLPPCAGVALGFDRLLMAVLGKQHIREVVAFDWARA